MLKLNSQRYVDSLYKNECEIFILSCARLMIIECSASHSTYFNYSYISPLNEKFHDMTMTNGRIKTHYSLVISTNSLFWDEICGGKRHVVWATLPVNKIALVRNRLALIQGQLFFSSFERELLLLWRELYKECASNNNKYTMHVVCIFDEHNIHVHCMYNSHIIIKYPLDLGNINSGKHLCFVDVILILF